MPRITCTLKAFGFVKASVFDVGNDRHLIGSLLSCELRYFSVISGVNYQPNP